MYTIDELASRLKTSASRLKSRLNWWRGCGVLKERDQTTWALCSDLPVSNNNNGPIVATDEEEQEPSNSNDDEREKQLEVNF